MVKVIRTIALLNMGDLTAVVAVQYRPPFYLIVDQRNALEVDVGKIDLQ